MFPLRIDARDGTLLMPEGTDLTGALRALPRGAPVVIMVHGYKYSPFVPESDPHRQIYALRPGLPGWKIRSWPRGLGFPGAGGAAGLCIGFGWHATAPRLVSGLAQVHARSAAAGGALADLLRRVAEADPGREIDLFAHSLGGRVALAALAGCPVPLRGRAILMGAADYRAGAEAALANPAARAVEVFNVISRENDIFDLFFRTIVPPARQGDRVLGAGLPDAPPRWVDIAIDDPAVLAALARRGLRIAPRMRRHCHWSFYRRPGIWRLYRALLRERAAWPAALLRQGLPQPAARAAPVSFWPGPALPGRRAGA